MKEADLRAEVGASLRRLWYRTYTGPDMTVCPKCGEKIFPRGGTPDTFFWNWKGPFGVIEYKVFPSPTDGAWARTSFDLAKISPEQRAWMLYAHETGAYHIYLGLGTVHGTAGAKKNPRLAWVVPWAYWVAVEKKLLPIQRSLPLTMRKGLRREIQDNQLVATVMLKGYELEWARGEWQFPQGHPVWQAHLLRHGYSQDLRASRARWNIIREEQREIWPTNH